MRHSGFGRAARAPVFSGTYRRQAPGQQKKEAGFDEAIRALVAMPGTP